MLYILNITSVDSNSPGLFPFLLVKTFYVLHFSETINSAIEREISCKEKFNYNNFIFNQGEKKKDHN